MTTDSAKSIPAFYAGQSIFLTGATGFLGKVFIEKVLRSCPNVREIFLLIRSRKGLNINERLEEILNLPLYEKLRAELPSNFKKLIPISGDAKEEGLGLSAADKQILIQRVTMIIHGAASVKFNNSLKYAIFSNTRATRDICILAQSMKNLKALVYIGTAFVHTHVPIIEEKVYPPITDWKKMIKMAESLDEHTLNIFTAKCLDYAPNTYIFSKKLSENIIQEYSSSLPCAIVRPSIVVSSLKEPMPGWLDNIYGPLGITIGGSKGLLRVVYCNKNAHENGVPVDIVIKAIIVVAWKIGLSTFTVDSTPFVLNCTNQKHVTYHQCKIMSCDVETEIPLEGRIWTPGSIITDNFTLFYILKILSHILPAVLIDLVLYFSGRRPMLLQLQRKVYMINKILGHFSLHDWKYNNTNTTTLISLIPPDDCDMFSFTYSHINVREYLKNAVIGIKLHLLHEDMNRLDAVKAHNKRVYWFVTIVETIISISLMWIIYKWIYS